MKIYNLYPDSTQWYCQWKHDSIFFALINSGALGPLHFSWLNPNENMEEKSPEERILFELKVVTAWAVMTKLYPFGHKGIFHDIYMAFMLLTENKAKMDENVYRKKVLFYEKKIGEFFDFFAGYEKESLNDQTLGLGKHIRLRTEDFASLDGLPERTLLCVENRRWVVYLKADGDFAVTLDSKIYDSCGRIHVSALMGQKIIRPDGIQIDSRVTDNLLFDISTDPCETLDVLSRREFSQKITECIGKLEQISFTEHDYRRFVRQAKSSLEKLDKEHYKSPCL